MDPLKLQGACVPPSGVWGHPFRRAQPQASLGPGRLSALCVGQDGSSVFPLCMVMKEGLVEDTSCISAENYTYKETRVLLGGY